MTSRSTASPASNWVRCWKINPRARLRLFCLPYAGAGASVYRTWVSSLPESIELCAIQLPGRENRINEPALTSMPALLAALADALRPWLDRPCALFGHSMGAAIGFELAQALEQDASTQLLHLFVSGRHAPGTQSHTPSIYTLPDPEFLRRLCDLYGGIPAPILEDEELLALYLPLLRADFTLLQSHRATELPLLSCPVTAFGGEQDKTVRREDLSEWKKRTWGRFVLQMFPGDHFYIKQPPADLLRSIAQTLDSLP